MTFTSYAMALVSGSSPQDSLVLKNIPSLLLCLPSKIEFVLIVSTFAPTIYSIYCSCLHHAKQTTWARSSMHTQLLTLQVLSLHSLTLSAAYDTIGHFSNPNITFSWLFAYFSDDSFCFIWVLLFLTSPFKCWCVPEFHPCPSFHLTLFLWVNSPIPMASPLC